ncbi:MAG: HEAT repeat domain-containing protein [Deltaproteobacteria bacterium]|nr:MAG: HEAT repeat domain-containing protein [Deltaproteobacteria bacterium]
MGFFDFMFGGEDAQLKRHARRMVNLNAQAEDREMSAHWLAENGSHDAIVALLNRFSVRYEQGMKDAAEKEMVYRLLVELGPDVVEPVKEWARINDAFAQPLRLVEHFEGPEAAVELLLEMLKTEDDPFKPEKKRQILIHLADFRDPRIPDGVKAALRDFDEGVRFAACGALLAQDADDEIRDLLASVLADPDEDSNRMKVRIAEAFHQRGWSLGRHAEEIARHPPHGWTVQGQRIVPA